MDEPSLYTPRLAAFEWRPEDELDHRIYHTVRRHGCSVISVESSATSPEYTYTAGLYHNFLHPEILIMGLHSDTAGSIAGKLRQSAIAGTPPPDTTTVRHELFEDH